MDSFYGNWKVVLNKNEGLAEIWTILGWSKEKQNEYASIIYTVTLEHFSDKHRCFVDYGSATMEFFFTLGELFDYVGVDGTKAVCTVTLENGKLIEEFSTIEGHKWRTERVVDGSKMTANTQFHGHPEIKCVQELSKV